MINYMYVGKNHKFKVSPGFLKLQQIFKISNKETNIFNSILQNRFKKQTNALHKSNSLPCNLK